ncbi:metallophosphoesterase [Micromonospora craterilacus]|uniref:Metallophosphoesterase n=1 Tax=Micromonospora craterilacus TaxID=1655439 RepID=A0A2W2DW58_9ACTN|nr:metallophosphoesterase [Micromonospora craterilacus]
MSDGPSPTNTLALRFLFRYRDLVADTLPEHRAVLRERGWCWWGWWKRPNEPGRAEVWETLDRETAAGQRVRIGLFHSGTGTVHPAVVERVIVPHADDLGSFVSLSPPEAERDGVPAYYRSSRHSRGWLRLVALAEEPIEFFGRFSLASAPPLPHHPASQLERLVGKRILDADELRTMDTTIWEVRPAQPSDSSERFLTASQRQDGALSAEPVACPGPWLLHLTDPHYATGQFRSEHQWRLETEDGATRPTMVDAISNALAHHQRSVGAVLVTGDLTYVAAPEEFKAARAGLFKLTNGLLGLGMEHLVVVPGNHDIMWTRSDTYEYAAPVEVAPAEATANYRSFFQALYGYPASPHLSMARRFVFPGGNLVDVAAVNSSSLEQGRSFLAGMGRVQEAAYREVTSALSWSSPGSALRVLALHHHLALTEDLESPDEFASGFGIAVDAPRIQRMAARDGVHLAVHGHKHRAFVWRTGAYHLPEYNNERWELGSFNIVGGGSSGSISSDGRRNFFNLIRVAGPVVELEMYRSQQQGSFERFMSWRAPLVSGAGARLEIAPWQVGS